MHGLFLNRLATHPVLKDDSNFQIFLEYQDANGVIIDNIIECRLLNISLETLGGIEKSPELSKTVLKVAETYEKCRKLEARVSSD
ncbi:hypothetical protein D917_06944, partial [Trichinella nativa]